MRARNIKPAFFKNEELAECSLFARLLFIGLWCMADREGRLEKRPLRIKAEIFPYDSLNINGELTVLERKGFIKTYVVDGKEYLHVVNFLDHQSPHHTEVKSKLPDISDGCPLTVDSPLGNGKNPPDSLIPDSLIPDSLIPDSGFTDSVEAVSVPVKPSRPTVEKLTDEEWALSLKTNPAYEGLDVEREIAKCGTWCETNRRHISRKRIINWLNRAEKPVAFNVTRHRPLTFADSAEMRAQEQRQAFLEGV